MKILWISWKDPTHPDAGGAELVGEHHALSWIAAGHSVHWVSTGYTNSPVVADYKGITIQHIGKKWYAYCGLFHLIIFFKYITAWKNQFDFIVDEYHGVATGMPLYVKKPILAVIHEVAGNIWQKMFPFPISYFGQYSLEPLMLNLYKKTPILVGSLSTKNDLVKEGIPEKNITHIPYGADFPVIDINTIEKESTSTLVYLSELRPVKGFDRVYEAFKKIKQTIPDIQLWVLGNDKTEFGQSIKQKIVEEKYNDAITFFGKASAQEKFARLQKAHLLVHGSYKEGWGIVVIEANAVGTPAVAFDAPGLRDCIKDQQTGFLAKDQNQFVEYINILLTNQVKYKQFQQNAYHWSQQFTWQNSTNQSLQLIENISKQSKI